MEAKGISNATLIGNSVGAVFAVAVTAIKRTMVDKLILVGCPCWETKRERENAKAIVKANYDDHGIPLAYSLEKLKQSYTKVSPELLAKVNEDRRKAGIWAWKCLDALTQFDIVPALRRVRARTLLIYGEQDKLRDKENALHNYIMNSTLAIVPDAGHLPQLDNPHAFLEVVQPFLESSG
jgi:pimeloyl-ACP methyl ester carboxylesterase